MMQSLARWCSWAFFSCWLASSVLAQNRPFPVHGGIGLAFSQMKNQFCTAVDLNFRYNFWQHKNNDWSAGLGTDLDIQFGGSTVSGGKRSYLGVSIPALASFNYGLGATHQSSQNRVFGAYLNAGFNFVGSKYKYNYDQVVRIHLQKSDARYGFIAGGGFRFTYTGFVFSVGVDVTKTFNNAGKIITFKFLLNFLAP